MTTINSGDERSSADPSTSAAVNAEPAAEDEAPPVKTLPIVAMGELAPEAVIVAAVVAPDVLVGGDPPMDEPPQRGAQDVLASPSDGTAKDDETGDGPFGNARPRDGATGDGLFRGDLPGDGCGCEGIDSADTVFSQQLWEVQLLLDFLSGNPIRRLPDKNAAALAGLSEDWIAQICRITWPPSGTPAGQAEQEAMLIEVKDYLNAMAAPASGASVAFTLLVAQEEATDTSKSKTGDHQDRSGQGGGLRHIAQSLSRRSLARKAYPDLSAKAMSFRRGMFWIATALTAWLAITCALTWYVSMGDAGLRRLAAAEVAVQDVRTKIDAAQSAHPDITTGNTSPNATGTTASSGKPSAPNFAPASPGVTFCDQPLLLPRQRTPTGQMLAVYNSPAQAMLCADLQRQTASLADAERHTQTWYHFGGTDESKSTAAAENAAAWFGTLGNSVLPICYGILGAAAAVLRLLSRRMRLSLLTPRDLTLSLQQLALGAVVGACIGLFVATPESSSGGTLLGSVKLSGSALSFVAGFGVDAVFSALEALIARLFATAPAPAK